MGGPLAVACHACHLLSLHWFEAGSKTLQKSGRQTEDGPYFDAQQQKIALTIGIRTLTSRHHSCSHYPESAIEAKQSAVEIQHSSRLTNADGENPTVGANCKDLCPTTCNDRAESELLPLQ